MHKLTNISTTMTLIALSTTLFMSASMAQTASNSTTSNNNAPINHTTAASSATANTSSSTTATTPAADVSTFTSAADASNASVDASTRANAPTDVSPVTSGVSQKLIGNSKTATSLNKLLPTIEYTTDNLPTFAQKVNSANWKPDTNVSRSMSTKLQALLNWHQNSVGPVDGYWGKNSIKAMQAFQKSRGLKITNNLNEETWQALAQNEKLMSQPVLVSYKLSDADVNIKTVTIPTDTEAKSKLEGMYYESVIEALAEKFHMSEKYLQALNPNATFKAGETITVYNPANPNTKQVSRVVADQATETLYAYDEQNNLVASYPTTVGSTATPSPTGTHKVKVKVHEPNYTYTGKDGNKLIIPPGPNNPVGVVWIGLSKPSYGIHGSPDPARISRQASSGCVRLTNWDALALLGTIKDDATVEFK